MDLEREEDENRIQIKKPNLGDIHFKNVTFRYGTRVEVFKKLNLVIPRGKITALVGESGSGKSTLISLLHNLYPIQKGTISIGEIDLKHVDNSSLRDIISVVPQKIDLFAGNVIENIAVGEFAPEMERVIRICKRIGILDFIEDLPNGFNTYLGENGATLSGGEKQRIAIARAMYKEPEVLVLDEATSALDSSSENYVQKAVESFNKTNKTTVIIAHRLSTVFRAHKIVVLSKGKVMEQGSHSELYKRKGIYHKLWQQQLPQSF
jgi:ATP-binding cassette subfamily B protein